MNGEWPGGVTPQDVLGKVEQLEELIRLLKWWVFFVVLAIIAHSVWKYFESKKILASQKRSEKFIQDGVEDMKGYLDLAKQHGTIIDEKVHTLTRKIDDMNKMTKRLDHVVDAQHLLGGISGDGDIPVVQAPVTVVTTRE